MQDRGEANNMKSNFFKYVFGIFVVGIMIFAIYKIKTEEEVTKQEQTHVSTEEQKITEITLGVASFDSTNPILSHNKNIQDVSRLIYEPLFNLTQDYKLESCLAQEWAKQDSTTYIIKLKDNVRWSNGEKFVADDVKFTIEKLKSVDSIYTSNVQNIANIEITDDYTLKIILDKEIPFFEYNLVFPIMSSSFYLDKEFNEGIVPIGTGMYKYSDVQSTHLVLVKNNNWWNTKTNLTLNKITINLYSSLAELYNSFKMGNIDIVATDNSNLQDYIGTIGYAKKEMKGREHVFISLNMSNTLLSRQEVRKAISYSIDKTNITSSIFNNNYYTSDFPLDYGNWLYSNQNASAGYNPEQAKQLLTDAGWVYRNGYWQKTENYKTVRLILNLAVKASDSTMVNVAQNIKSQLGSQGINVNIVQLQDNDYYNSINSKNYDMVLCGINLSLSPSLETFFGVNNMANYSNDEVNNILNEVKNTTDENTLIDRYKRLAEIYRDDVPYISLYNNKFTVAYSTGLIGDVTPNWFNIFYNISGWYK